MSGLKLHASVKQRRRVDFIRDKVDQNILQLAVIGRPLKYIAFATNRSIGQVYYRLKRGKSFRLRDIRGGSDTHHMMATLESNGFVQRLTKNIVKDVLEKEHVTRDGKMVDNRVRKHEPTYQGKIDNAKTL